MFKCPNKVAILKRKLVNRTSNHSNEDTTMTSGDEIQTDVDDVNHNDNSFLIVNV